MKINILSIILIFSSLKATELPNLLDDNYNNLYELKLEKERYQKKYDTLNFVAPLNLNLEREIDHTYVNTTSTSTKFSISIDQPIFKSGGIYYGIKFAEESYEYNKLRIQQEKKRLIVQAIQLAYQLKLYEYEKRKTKLEIKNKNLELATYEKLLDAGYINSLDIDNLLIKLTELKAELYDIEVNIKEALYRFKEISYKNPHKIKLPTLSLVSKRKFVKDNYNVKIARKGVELTKYKQKITSAKYLPTVSVGLEVGRMHASSEAYRRYYNNIKLRVSMPISLNRSNDLEIARLNHLISKLELRTTEKRIGNSYDSIENSFNLYEQKIAVLEDEIKIYKRLLKKIKKLQKFGEKDKTESLIIENYLKIKKYEITILNIKKQLTLLNLYKDLYL